MITGYIDKIKNAVLGKDVKSAIADGLEQAYNDAIDAGNSAAEVSVASGKYPSLGERINAEETSLQQLNDKIASLNIVISNDESTTISAGQILVVYEE